MSLCAQFDPCCFMAHGRHGEIVEYNKRVQARGLLTDDSIQISRSVGSTRACTRSQAEAEGHHPDLHITQYRNVKVEVYTHSVGGLCLNDFILAAKLDGIVADLG